MRKKYDCGIDLGTTNSCIAKSEDGLSVQIIESITDNLSTTPSAVYISKSGKMLVGQSAYNVADRRNVALQFKRMMGTDSEITFKSSGIKKLPEELSAEILKKLRGDYQSRIGEEALDVVITIPAAFNSLQSEATLKAGAMAGFRKIYLLQEPIAAAIAYGIRPDSKDKNWMVFDYGGGTLDVAIVSTFNGRLKVINSEGNNFFGGCDIDECVLDKIILPKLQEEYVIEVPMKKALRNKLLLEVDNAKKNLLNKEYTSFMVTGVMDDEGEEIEFEYEITREEFENAIADTVDEAIAIAENAVEGSGINKETIEKILLVGGSTFLEYVRKRLAEYFGTEVDCSVNPMHAVAIGAALYASDNYIEIEEIANQDVENEKIINQDVENPENCSEEVETGLNDVVSQENISVSLSYSDKTSKEKEDVVGQVKNLPGDGYCISIQNDTWSTGMIPLAEDGLFFASVKMEAEGLYEWQVKLYDNAQREQEFKGDHSIAIKRQENILKLSAAPMTHSVCVGIMENGFERLDVVLQKNTRVPATNSVTYRVNKDLKKGSNESIQFHIYEGEIYENPVANILAGTIRINGVDLDRDIKKDEEVILKLSVDENRNIHVSGTFAQSNYHIPEQKLLEKNMMNLERRLDELEEHFKAARISLNKIKGVVLQLEYDSLEKTYYQLLEQYDEQIDLLDEEPATVYKYIDKFYQFHTKLIRIERLTNQNTKLKMARDSYRDDVLAIQEYGTYEDVQKLHEYEKLIESTEDEEKMRYYSEKIKDLSLKSRIKSVDFFENRLRYFQERAEERGLLQNESYQFQEAKYKEALQEGNVERLLKEHSLMYEIVIPEQESEFWDYKKKFKQIIESPHLNREDEEVQFLIRQGEQASQQYDKETMGSILERLSTLLIKSTNEIAEKRQSNLRK